LQQGVDGQCGQALRWIILVQGKVLARQGVQRRSLLGVERSLLKQNLPKRLIRLLGQCVEGGTHFRLRNEIKEPGQQAVQQVAICVSHNEWIVACATAEPSSGQAFEYGVFRIARNGNSPYQSRRHGDNGAWCVFYFSLAPRLELLRC
jgi:hypothetical protein